MSSNWDNPLEYLRRFVGAQPVSQPTITPPEQPDGPPAPPERVPLPPAQPPPPQPSARRLPPAPPPPPELTPDQVVIGSDVATGYPVGLEPADRALMTYVIGSIGTGKSELLYQI